MSDTATLVVERLDKGLSDCLRAYSVYVDGEKVGHLRRGKTLTVSRPPGRAAVYFRLDYGRSRILEVPLTRGQVGVLAEFRRLASLADLGPHLRDVWV